MRLKQKKKPIIRPFPNPDYCTSYIGISNDLRLKRYSRRDYAWKDTAIMITLLVILLLLLSKAIVYSLDTSIRNQDIMLCESALRSRNRDYLDKCECYYETNEISCIQKGGETQ